MPALGTGIHTARNGIDFSGSHWIDAVPGVSAQLSSLRPVVVTQQVGRDAKKPGSGVGPLGLESSACGERLNERLSRKFLGYRGANSAAEVAVDGVEMPFENRAELARIRKRVGD